MKWHDLKNNPSDLPNENEEVIVRVCSSIFEYSIMVYSKGEWKGLNIPSNKANILAWSYID